MNKNYLQGVIDATIENNKLGGIESQTIEFGHRYADLKECDVLIAQWESGTKLIALARYEHPQEVETIYSEKHIFIKEETTLTQIIEFITNCTEQAMKDEFNPKEY